MEEKNYPDYATMQNYWKPENSLDATLLLIAKGDFVQLENLLFKGLLFVDAPFLQQLVYMGHEDKICDYLKHNEWISSDFLIKEDKLLFSAARDVKNWLGAFRGEEEAQDFILRKHIAKLLPFLDSSLLVEKGEWQALADKREWKLLAEHQKFELISAESDDGADVLLQYKQDERVIAAKNWKAFLRVKRGKKILAERGEFEVLYNTKRNVGVNSHLFQLILDHGGADFLREKGEGIFLLEGACSPETYVKAKDWLPLYKYGYDDLIDWDNWYHQWCKSDYSGFIRLAVEKRQWEILNKYFGPALYREELFKQCRFWRWLRSFF